MAGERVLKWEEILGLVPGTTVDEVLSYQDDKFDKGPKY
jgi:hypothetical protein